MASRIKPQRVVACVATIALATGSLSAGQRAGQAPRGAAPLVMDDQAGFTPIFDGTTMTGWDADPSFWRAEGGSLIGESTAENPVKENTFAIWRGGEPTDFELKVQFRMNATNSGIQIRSAHVPQGTPSDRPVAGKWVLKGYQADIDFGNQYTGQIYEERGRGFLALRGQAVYVPDGAGPKVIGHLQQTPDELKALIKANDWNQVHLIARGTTIIQILNGAVTSIVVDDDTKNRSLGGLIGFQIHTGNPMKVELRNIWLKDLAAKADATRGKLERVLGARTQAGKGTDAPPTRDEILKQGPAALEQNCTQCHQSDKWEGTYRDHDGWAAIVGEMARQMVEAGMPPMSEKTLNLIVDYLTLTRPQ